MLLPMISRGKLLGVMTFATAESGRRYTDRDLVLAEDLARRAAQALDNALLFRESQRSLEQHRRAEEELTKLKNELEAKVEVRTQQLIKKDEELHRAAKLEAVGRLAAGVAHDFNNLLTGITGLAEELKESLGSEDPRHTTAAEIITIGDRAFALTRQLLTFGSRQTAQPRVLNLNDVVLDTKKLLERLIGEDISLNLDLAATCLVEMDPGHIGQIIVNLAVNARDAMRGGGGLTIRTADVDLDDAGSPRRIGVRSGRYVMLEVADTGHGMTPDVLAHIFEPFFTTKGKDSGTGLGLSTVYGIVKQAGGDLQVHSQPGLGTSFKLYFPCRPA